MNMKKKISYNSVFGATRALQALFGLSLPISLSLSLAELFESLAPLQARGQAALGSTPTHERVEELAATQVEVEFTPINKTVLIQSLETIEPYILYNLNPFYEADS